MAFLDGFSKYISIDLGTANTLIYINGKGIVLNEPSVIAINEKTKLVIAVGKEAKAMVGKESRNVKVVRPVLDGVISDYDVTEQMLRQFLQKVYKNRGFIRPKVVVCIPCGVTEVEKRAVKDVTVQAGAREAVIIEEPMAAAIGAGIMTMESEGNLIIDIGGGTTEVALISLGGIVVSESVRVAGDAMDAAILNALKLEFNLAIGDSTAELVKKTIGSAVVDQDFDKKTMDVRGRDLVSGLPKTITITAKQVRKILEPVIDEIIEAVRNTLERTPPELASDLMRRGLLLTGGGALLHGLDKKLSQITDMSVIIPDDPLIVVAIGAGKYLDYIASSKK
jgi:rod shape-determining protein MreB